MRILVDENIPQGPEVFAAYGDVRVFAGRALRREDLRETDALMVRSVTPVNETLLRGTPVRFVGTATIGTDHVDRDFLRRAGIGFASAPGCNARSVAEYVVAALLHLRDRHALELEGKTLGIVGCGHVGSALAGLAPHLGLKVLLCDPPLAQSGKAGPFLSLRELAERSDILTVHVPLVENGRHATRKMLGRDFFAAFNRPKALIHTARGEVMDEAELARALDRKSVSHLALDVFCGEPAIDSRLAMRADLITPHIAGYSIQGKLNGTGMLLDAFCRHFKIGKKTTVLYPAAPHPVILIPGGESGLKPVLSHCVAHAYDIVRDDAALRGVLEGPDPIRGFDALRRQYPERHEFAGFRVTGIAPREVALRRSLSDLGFSLD